MSRPFPQLYDWLVLIAFLLVAAWNVVAFGVAGLVVWLLFLFAAYRLGKVLGR